MGEMIGPAEHYCGDDRMAGYLREIGAPCSLLEIYGLFHGCVAAPVMVPPSKYLPMILGDPTFDSEKQTNRLLGNLMTLWNRIAKWNSGEEPFMKPAVKFPVTLEGLRDRVGNWYSLTEYFIKGLDLGGTGESDFSDDAADALKSLAEVQGILQNYSELFKKDTGSEKELEDTGQMLVKLESIIGDCIARINAGLKPARTEAAEQMHRSFEQKTEAVQAMRRKIGRNEPCPCGSGIKYKKCCGFTH